MQPRRRPPILVASYGKQEPRSTGGNSDVISGAKGGNVLALKGATILTPEKTIAAGTILVEAGRITAVGVDIDIPASADVLDLSGKTVIPGMIDAHCHTGIFADGVGWAHSDGNEMTDPITPHLRAIDAVHPEDKAFGDLREAGVTCIGTGPGSGNLVGGQTAVLKTRGRTVEEMLLRYPVGMKMALGENPKRVYGEQKRTPSTRMGNAGVLREWLTKAQTYMARKAAHEQKLAAFRAGEKDAKEPDPFETDLKLEALAKILTREIPAHIHAHRADDIMTALRLAKEFQLDPILIHATEGYKIADVLAAEGIPCVPGPILISRSKYELRELNPKNAALLSRAGVKIAIQTDQMSAVRHIRLDAAVAINAGMSDEEALRAITLTPAEILRVDDRVGSIAVGKDADLVVLSGAPFDVAHSRVLRVFIEGETVFDAANG
ncbi:MAG TPA: amidohydrolase [Candidatus Acetothermia bacterium]|nr:amidohydrolase [Candidatus Acetothermia bacterium]